MRKIAPVLILTALALCLSAQSREQLFDQGLGAFQDKLYEDALVNFDAYLERYPGETRADAVLYMSGVALYSLERYALSLERLDRLVREKPDSPYLRRTAYWQALDHYALMAWDEAEKAFEKQLAYAGETYYLERSYLYLGLLREKRGDYAAAAGSYASLISLSANTELVTQAYYRRGLAWLNLGDYERALPNFERLSTDYGSSPYSRAMPYYIGLCYLNLGKPDEARRRFELYLKLFPAGEYREEVTFQLARAESEAGRKERSLELLAELEKGGADSPYARRALNMKAENLSALGETGSAREVWTALLKEEPAGDERDRIAYNVGLTWLREGNREEAEKWFRDTMARPESPVRRDALDALTSLALERGDRELALGYGKTLFDDYPDAPGREETGAMVAALMMELDRTDMLEAHLKIMVGLYGGGGKNDLYLMMLAETAMDRESWTEALTWLGKLASGYPQSEYREEALYRLGYIYVLREEYIRGAGYFEELLGLEKELTPEVEEDSRYSLALCYYKVDQGEKALPLFEDYLKRYEDSRRAGETALYMGDIRFDRREWIRAAELFARAGTILAGYDGDLQREAAFKEALSRQKNREWDRAEALFLSLARDNPDGPYGEESLYQGGICRIERGDPAGAEEIFAEAVLTTAGEVRERSLYQLARIALEGGDRPEAVRLARLMRADYPGSDLGVNLFFSEAEDAWALEDYALAREWYLLCGDVFPEQADALQAPLRASLALAESGQIPLAVDELFQGIREGLARGEGETLYARAAALGRLTAEQGDGEQAQALLTELSGLTGDISLLAPLVIGTERSGGSPEGGSEYLESIYRAEELPFSLRTEALLLLARYRIADGRPEEAESYYRVVMESDKGALGAEANYRAGELIALTDPGRGAQELLNVSYNYPAQDIWAARALYRSWEIYRTLEEGQKRADIVRDKLLGLYPDSEEASLMEK